MAMRWHWTERARRFAIWLFICALVGCFVALLVAYSVNRHDAKTKCVNEGGVVNEYNCGRGGCLDWQCVYR